MKQIRLFLLILSFLLNAACVWALTCVQVIDGDTIRLDNGTTIRLLGIDAPESRDNAKLRRETSSKKEREAVISLGRQSKNYLKNLAEHQNVKLVLDLPKRDRFGRTLAYVYLEDGTMINAEMIRQGYAEPFMLTSLKHKVLFEKLYREALAQRRGLWKDSTSSSVLAQE